MEVPAYNVHVLEYTDVNQYNYQLLYYLYSPNGIKRGDFTLYNKVLFEHNETLVEHKEALVEYNENLRDENFLDTTHHVEHNEKLVGHDEIFLKSNKIFVN